MATAPARVEPAPPRSVAAGASAIHYLSYASVPTHTANSIQIMRKYDPAIMIQLARSSSLEDTAFEWKMTPGWAVVTTVIAIWGVMDLNRASEFLYFNF